MFLDKHILHSPSESPQWKGATVVNGNNLLINIFYWLFSFYFLTFTILLFILPGILPQINHPHPILVSGIGLGGIQIKNRREWLPVIGNTWGHVSEGISRIKEPTRLAECVSVWRWEMGCWIGELLVVCITSRYEVFVWDKKKSAPLWTNATCWTYSIFVFPQEDEAYHQRLRLSSLIGLDFSFLLTLVQREEMSLGR